MSAPTHNEALVVVNGVTLTSAQSLTLRVALESFASHLISDGLGDDEHGRTMVRLYLQRVDEIRQALYR